MVTKVIAVSLSLIAGLFRTRAVTAELLGTKPVYVEGMSDCGDWLSSRQNQTSIALQNFVIGMLNGLAMGVDREYWKADGRMISRDAAYFSVDQYCRQNPTDLLVMAISSIFKQRVEGGTANRQ